MNKLKNAGFLGSLKDNKFFGDLYRDLRERHLLPVVIVLVAAIAAVPLLLRSEPESTPPPHVEVTGEEATAAVPAVLADDPGVRDYRERLEALQNKNPFDAKFSLPKAESSSVQDVSGSSSEVSGGDTSVSVDTGDSTVPSDDTSSTSAPVEPSSSSSDSSAPPVDVEVSDDDSATVDDDSDGGGEPPVDEWFLYEHRIDVVVGRAGEAKPQDDVKPLSLLPGKSSPVLIYFGANIQADQAIFSVSRDVTASTGDGTCLPSAKVCEFLQLGIGEQRTLEYAPAGPGGTFVIRLKDIRREVVDKIDGDPFEGKPKDQAEVPSELSAWLGLSG
jgi:hypothetical protein